MSPRSSNGAGFLSAHGLLLLLLWMVNRPHIYYSTILHRVLVFKVMQH